MMRRSKLGPLVGENEAKLFSGMLDVLFAFARCLELKGALTRGEIADLLETARGDIERQEGGASARTFVVDRMIEAFRMPVAGADARSRLRIVDGPEPPCGDGA
jgi:hypothetical protein